MDFDEIFSFNRHYYFFVNKIKVQKIFYTLFIKTGQEIIFILLKEKNTVKFFYCYSLSTFLYSERNISIEKEQRQ